MQKEKRGRKPLPTGEKKKALTIFVKAKFVKVAEKELKDIEKKYQAL
jgi:hypothetical protein